MLVRHEFYKRNVDHFYKDRHYLHVVFPELNGSCSDGTLRLMEVGSGVGNAVFPLLEVNPCLQVFAFDFARSAIEIMTRSSVYEQLNLTSNRILGGRNTRIKPVHWYFFITIVSIL